MLINLQCKCALSTMGITLSFFVANAQDKVGASAEELAKKLANPIASLISVPFQNNVEYGIGPHQGAKYTLNFQPIIPFQLSPKLNLITRYIIPVVDQQDISAESAGEFGLSDATVSGFFSPVNPKNGLIIGAGPAFLFPIGTNDVLSTRKWAIGPTVILAKQASALTYGFLVNQLWSFAGDDSRSDVNQMFLQPFVTHNWKSGAGVNLNEEMTFNWETNTTNIMLSPGISGITRLGKQTVSLSLGPKIPLAGPAESKPDFGLRATMTMVFGH